MKRIRTLKWLAGVMAVSSTTLMADVTLDFNYGGANLNGAQPLTLALSVDGTGIVSLDASTGNTNAPFVAAVDAWDSSNVGVISETSLFGTSFTLTSDSEGKGIALVNTDTGVLGISGLNAGRIDNIGLERLTFNASGLASGVALDIKTVSYGGRAATGASNVKLEDSDTSTVYVIPPPTAGVLDLSGAGFAIAHGEGLTFTTDSTTGVAAAGYGLAGFTFDVVVIPEPTTISLLGIAGLGLFMRRRLAS